MMKSVTRNPNRIAKLDHKATRNLESPPKTLPDQVEKYEGTTTGPDPEVFALKRSEIGESKTPESAPPEEKGSFLTRAASTIATHVSGLATAAPFLAGMLLSAAPMASDQAAMLLPEIPIGLSIAAAAAPVAVAAGLAVKEAIKAYRKSTTLGDKAALVGMTGVGLTLAASPILWLTAGPALWVVGGIKAATAVSDKVQGLFNKQPPSDS